MHLRIDPNSGVPLAVQIARGLRLAVSSGRLSPGERLPGSRELAASLGVNFHTVRRALAELEAAGILETRHGVGTFVTERVRLLSPAEFRALVRAHLERLAEDLAGSGVDAERAEAVLLEEWRRALGARRVRP
ncbi:MAG: GntR family transcriptional regulator [Planctomycetaceae bacterium]|nr:GntR family transcriptional regulator [Planctomycetota bacterium]NUN53367.1 GntR family transcriptional regulator [Planctomycetaceae bacterium]